MDMTLKEAEEVMRTMLTEDPQFDPEKRRKAVEMSIDALLLAQKIEGMGLGLGMIDKVFGMVE